MFNRKPYFYNEIFTGGASRYRLFVGDGHTTVPRYSRLILLKITESKDTCLSWGKTVVSKESK